MGHDLWEFGRSQKVDHGVEKIDLTPATNDPERFVRGS